MAEAWEQAWPEAEQALKEAAKHHAAMLMKESTAAREAQRRARAAEKALGALPAALQRAATAEAALRELQAISAASPSAHVMGSPSIPQPPPPSERASISEEAAAAATAEAVDAAVGATEDEAECRYAPGLMATPDAPQHITPRQALAHVPE